jgi:cation:H+ antiporter
MPVEILMAFGGLVLLLGASEVMVRQLSAVGESLALPPHVLGFLVAAGADSPEISTAIIALITGSSSIGLGVVEGSNIYNLAGLLGLSAIVAGSIVFSRRELIRGGLSNAILTVLIIALVFLPGPRLLLAVVALVGSAIFFFTLASEPREPRETHLNVRALAFSVAASLVLIAASAVLVNAVEQLILLADIPVPVVSILLLPVATSIPNTWAAIGLARQGLGDAVLSAVFNSNLINLSLGIALPSLFIDLHPDHAARVFDGPYLVGMTLFTVIMLETSRKLTRPEGFVIIALYLIFISVRLLVI